MIIPSLRLISFEVHAKTRVIALIMIRKAMSIIFSRANPTGLIAAATPSTKRILKILEPMTLPSAYDSSFLEATMEVTSSGRLVPMAMIVSPISVWLSPRLDAIEDAPSTTKSPPYLIAIIPPNMKMRHSITEGGCMEAILSISFLGSELLTFVQKKNPQKLYCDVLFWQSGSSRADIRQI